MWSNMMANQKLLDQRIWEQHGVKEHLIFEERVLALTDELMEYAKSTKCFKYWSTKEADPDHVRLEEFVDAIHFYMSLANTYGVTPEWFKEYEETAPKVKNNDKKKVITHHITKALRWIHLLNGTYAEEDEKAELLMMSFSHFWRAGQADGFDRKMIETAYYLKLQKNYKRQEESY